MRAWDGIECAERAATRLFHGAQGQAAREAFAESVTGEAPKGELDEHAPGYDRWRAGVSAARAARARVEGQAELFPAAS